ncbi:DUF3341 domain-containing protein [Rhodopila globiformis]|uniref:DUF3341 domain-containing protein n=1 Tax=Rhodopila globiformis TaxID=1071 RepID=A0A2S6NPJ4_RHOGL|nr:DUF3341 domain-containing protein [Rhodopila globiformis]PPQ40873.1 hypothetical protein CCS01_00035 [Rhodopila globiformis]
MSEESEFYGIAAEFAEPDGLLAAVSSLRSRGIGLLDALSPLPISGMDAALGTSGRSLGVAAVAGVLLGGFGCFGMIVIATVVAYPIIVGGRPLLSWPYYVIPSVAAAMLTGAVVLFVVMLFLDRLPRLNHPVFNIDGIQGVTTDRLFLVVEARTSDFDAEAVEHALAELPVRPLRIQRVER